MTGEHVEVRVTGKQEAVDAVLRLLRAGGPHVSPCKTPACHRSPVPGLLVCCIPCRSAPEGKHGPHTEVCDRRWAASVTVAHE